MNDSRIQSIAQIREFLKGSQGIDLSLRDSPIEEKYNFIDLTVDRLHYPAPHKEKREKNSLKLS